MRALYLLGGAAIALIGVYVAVPAPATSSTSRAS
jgi:hypothetical protein